MIEEPVKTEKTWPFDQPPDTAAITTRQVLEGKQPIRQVVHYGDDDSWAFTCGTTEETNDLKVVHMGHLLALDQTLRSISHLKPGWTAWRDDVGDEWELSPEDTD
jgi:hypothetical protein